MAQQGGWISRGRVHQHLAAIVILAIAAVATSCRGKPSPSAPPLSTDVLRVGVGQFAANNPLFGLRQLAQILTIESLARAGLDGQMQPWLAEGITRGDHDLSVTISLRPTEKFQDGTPLDAAAIVALLPNALKSFMGTLYSDIESIRATGPHALQIRFRQPSPLLLEALETQIRKPEMIGTGPFGVATDSSTELRANPDYHLGRPTIGRITVANYPNVRAAWAEILRGNLDMLYEVSPDALDSLKGSTSIATFSFTRPYQYLVALNPDAPCKRK